MTWKNNKEFVAKKFDAFGQNVNGQDIYIIEYKGYKDVTVEEEFDRFISEVDMLIKELSVKGITCTQ
jgi:hypothetical protein